MAKSICLTEKRGRKMSISHSLINGFTIKKNRAHIKKAVQPKSSVTQTIAPVVNKKNVKKTPGKRNSSPINNVSWGSAPDINI